jgi:chaperonin GroES
MKLQPMHGRVLVKPFEGEQKTAGGIYIPDTAKETLQEGEIIAVAEDATDEVAVGDRVIYKEFGGTEVRVDGEEYILFTEDDLLAKYVAADEIPE